MSECNCPEDSPFYWRTSDAQVSFKKQQEAAAMGVISRKAVDRSRAAGVEPMQLSALTTKKLAHDLEPKRFTVYSKAKASKP